VAQEALAELAELAVQVAREALAELAVPVAEQELNRVEAQERDPAAGRVPRQAAELEHGPAAVPNHRPDQLGVPRRTKSVTAAHHRGLVPVPKRAEVLAAAAETMRDKAATEAATAWVAAV
jgi:hypothetical protein